ncbi:MAG: alcohol dehydrogenase catalytic domain-containing protein [Chloroflexi bacterium]|nr:alcohol dehydrogenase catalytic domain-containing protein [Chloroflexota bacterium]
MSQTQLPEQMTAVILTAYKGAEALRIEQRPVPKLKPHELLIKVTASVINPSDLMFLQGMYDFQKSTPTIPGFEGSGTVWWLWAAKLV